PRSWGGAGARCFWWLQRRMLSSIAHEEATAKPLSMRPRQHLCRVARNRSRSASRRDWANVHRQHYETDKKTGKNVLKACTKLIGRPLPVCRNGTTPPEQPYRRCNLPHLSATRSYLADGLKAP